MKIKKIIPQFITVLFFITNITTTFSQTNNYQQEPVLVVVEQMPAFLGGQEAMIKFLSSNIQYPAIAKEKNISGVVIISFIVEKDGRVADAKVLKGIGGGCDEEALRVVNAMPNWTPGKQGGQPARVQFNLPIKFSLQ